MTSFARYLTLLKRRRKRKVLPTTHLVLSNSTLLSSTATRGWEAEKTLTAILFVVSPSLKSLVALDINPPGSGSARLHFPHLEYVTSLWSPGVMEKLNRHRLSNLRWLFIDGSRGNEDILTILPTLRHLRLEMSEAPKAVLPKSLPAPISTIIVDASEYSEWIGSRPGIVGYRCSRGAGGGPMIGAVAHPESPETYERRITTYREWAGELGQVKTWSYSRSGETQHANKLVEAWQDWMAGGGGWMAEVWTPV